MSYIVVIPFPAVGTLVITSEQFDAALTGQNSKVTSHDRPRPHPFLGVLQAYAIGHCPACWRKILSAHALAGIAQLAEGEPRSSPLTHARRARP
jgi:hypothetical protein